MAKKEIISVSLNKDVLDIVDKYKHDKDLNSRSAAIERIILENSINAEKVKEIVYKVLSENSFIVQDKPKENINTEVIDEVQKALNDSMKDIFKSVMK